MNAQNAEDNQSDLFDQETEYKKTNCSEKKCKRKEKRAGLCKKRIAVLNQNAPGEGMNVNQIYAECCGRKTNDQLSENTGDLHLGEENKHRSRLEKNGWTEVGNQRMYLKTDF